MPLITLPEHVWTYLKPKISFEVEEFWCLSLASNKRLKKAECLFRGSVDACLVHPREIFHFAVKTKASDIIIAHSHPSGDSTPSEADLLFTRKLQLASCFFEITVLDHLILAKKNYTSLLGTGHMESQKYFNEKMRDFFQSLDQHSPVECAPFEPTRLQGFR